MPRTGPLEELEVEWQFDALDLRPVRRFVEALGTPGSSGVTGDLGGADLAVAAASPRELADQYLDTDDWRVVRAGLVLRVRARGDGWEATLKDRAPASAGLRRRLEVTEQLGPGGIETLGRDGPVGRRIHALAGRRAMHRVLEVRTHRQPFTLSIGGRDSAEIALDETLVALPDDAPPLHLRRVEVEVDPGWVEPLTPLVQRMAAQCGLQPATLSKFEAGLLASGLHVPGAPDVGPTALSPAPTGGELATVVLRRNLLAMLAHEPGTRLGEDPEELHDMRVATRRMRAALSMFAEVLPVRARHVRAELGWLAGVLGSVRDLDVQLEETAASEAAGDKEDVRALEELAHVLERRRSAARERLLTTLESARYERLVTGFGSMLRQGPLRRSAPARIPATVVVPDLVAGRHRAVAKAARRARRSGAIEDYHRLRILAKRLRYALEFVSELYQGQTSKYVREIVRLQDALGRMQDARVAAEHLEEIVAGEGSSLPPRTVFVMGAVAERHRQEAARLARRVPGRLGVVSGSQWRRLSALLERRRLETTARLGWRPSVSRAVGSGASTVPGGGTVDTSPEVAASDGVGPARRGPTSVPGEPGLPTG